MPAGRVKWGRPDSNLEPRYYELAPHLQYSLGFAKVLSRQTSFSTDVVIVKINRFMAAKSQFSRNNPRSIAIALIVLALGILMLLWWVARPEPLPDFAAYQQVGAKKQAFFNYVGARVATANAALLADRGKLQELRAELDAEGSLSWMEQRWLNDLAERYEVEPDGDASAAELVGVLLRRVDIVPASLALVQAAKESGWGTARFAVEGNNLFGQQCFEKGCGQMPEQRAAGRRHEVADFDTVQASVQAYMHNLNTHPRYARFRSIRASQREREARKLSGITLADGLLAYSERGEAYVSEVKAMIRQNDLE